VPAGTTLFCFASESNSDCGVIPSVASFAQQPLPKTFGRFLQLGVIGAVAGHHVKNGIDVGELVIDHRPEQAGRQLVLHVNELLANQVEQIRHLLRRRRIAEGHLHRGKAGFRVGLHLLEVRQLLELFLDGVGDLHLHF
jgi:hypothetical protein